MTIRSDLDKALQRKLQAFEDAIGRTALGVDAELVEQTPVDTGRARSNWFASIGSPSGQTTEQTSPQTFDNKSIYDRYKLNQTIFITNNLPYIVPLNNGTSQQAPAGFVDATVAKYRRKVKEDFRQIERRF